MLGKIEGKRKSGQQRMRWLESLTDSTDMNLTKLRKMVKERGAWHVVVYYSQRVKHDLVIWVT